LIFRFLYLSLLFWCLCIVAVFGDSLKVDSSVQPTGSITDSALSFLISQQYAEARKQLAATDTGATPELRKLYLSFAIEQTRILDYESYVVENKTFQTYADSVKTIFEQALLQLSGRDSTECLFYLANIYGGIGVIQAKTGSLFDGVKNAVTSVSMLKQVKKRDSLFYAADLGIGVFDYYLSTSFKWLPFVESKEQDGLDALERALSAEFPYNYAAKNSLCWILIERKEFARADSLAQSVLDVYPENTIFLRIKALIALWTGKYPQAIKLGKQLVVISEKRSPQNWSDLVAGYTVLVKSYEETRMPDEACIAADILLRKKIPSSHRDIPHVKKNIKYIGSVAQKCRRGGR